MKRSELYKIRGLIEKAAASLPDDDALDAVYLFPEWKVGVKYTKDVSRVQRLEKLYECEQSHTSQADWPPESNPALWTEVAKPGEIPVWRQPTGAQDAYNTGDPVHFPTKDDPVYRSKIDGNVWSPAGYPQGWEQQNNNNNN